MKIFFFRPMGTDFDRVQLLFGLLHSFQVSWNMENGYLQHVYGNRLRQVARLVQLALVDGALGHGHQPLGRHGDQRSLLFHGKDKFDYSPNRIEQKRSGQISRPELIEDEPVLNLRIFNEDPPQKRAAK